MPTLRYVTKPMKRIRRNTISAMRKTENGKMSSTLTKEYSKYCAEVRQLRQILKDTQKCFKDINQAGIYEGTQVVYAELSEDEEAAISEQTNRMPNIVILGQDNHAKVKVANAILQREVLPSEQLSERWRSVVFRYGRSPSLSLQLPDSYELVDSRTVTERDWTQIPVEDLILTEQDMKDSDGAEEIAVLEASIRHTMLKEGGRVVVVQSFDEKLGKDGVKDVFHKFTADCIPVVIYTITSKFLSQEELLILEHIRALAPHLAIFFVHISDDDSEEEIAISKALNNMALELNKGSNSDQDSGLDNSSELDKRYSQRHAVYLSERESNSLSLFQQLVELGFLSLLPASDSNQFQLSTDSSSSESYYCDCELVEKFDGLGGIVNFTRRVLERYLLQTISLLHLVHTRCLQMFILSAYDMARDMQITPRKLQYAKAKEIELYDSLMELAVKKQEDIRNIIDQTIGNMHDELIQKAADYDFIGVDIPESCEVRSARDLKICTGQIQELMLSSLNSAIAVELLNSVSIMKDSYTGVLTRCLESLEQSDRESADSVRTSLALREILHAAYKVEITVRAGASVMRLLLEKMKQLIHMMPWKCPPVVNTEFKIRVAEDMLKSLNSTRLASSICSQIKEKLRESHESFTAALRQLEWRHSGRLERTEELRLKVRKVHAPRVARLVLESTSQRDYLQHGMPEMGREVGRGQYGVVYSCERWAGRGPCAIKSVVPPDDKHWNDLALEYFYTKNVPEHDRLVALRGSVIDYTYCGGSSPAVLLIMDRLQRDFYAAIKAGLDWAGRLQVAVDVVEGIRYLHSQGLVHRDIKLKNVLLDKKNRGKLTDLGFCKPEAMMSGSIVGTPIHMAPELFSGKYDASVDVYAFGVLFWYTCAGTVRLPLQFEQCTNKEMLWTSVKRGVRPEQLSSFTKECWELMRSCWQGDPLSRPLLGNVHQQLLDIQTLEAKKAANRDTSSASSSSSSSSSSSRKSPSSQASPRNPSTRPMPSRSSNRPVLNIPVNI